MSKNKQDISIRLGELKRLIQRYKEVKERYQYSIFANDKEQLLEIAKYEIYKEGRA